MMNNFSWKKILPHLIAIAIFLIVAFIYNRQALTGQVLQQSDIIHWKGMAQDASNYKDQHGHFPLWNTHLFSGMPNYQIEMGGKNFIINFTSILTLGLPQPISFFFLACICFYILTQAIGLRPVIGVLGSLAFAYATYNPVIIVAGHNTQMLAIAYMPALLAGVLLLYEKKYALGILTTVLFATCEIISNHPQVTYYCMLCIGIMSIFYIVKWVKAGEIKHMVLSLIMVILFALIGIGNTALALIPTYEYAKYTIRGGTSVNIDEQGKATAVKDKTSGLTTNYAFEYSLGKSEILSTAMPNAFGGSSGEMFDENSDQYNNVMQLAQQLNGKVPPQQIQMALQPLISKYWGGIQPFTSGPFFMGTLIVLLALIGFFATDSKHRWWILTSTVIFIFLAWGGYFTSFNEIMFKYFPFYNKFRAPSMAMVIPEMLLPLMASIAVEKLFFDKEAASYSQKEFKKILYVLGGFIVVAFIIYLGNDYSISNLELKRGILQFPGGGSVLSGLESARKSMFLAGIGRVLLFSLLLCACIFLYVKKIVKPVVAVIILLVINSFDILNVDAKYLNANNYMQPDDLQSQVFDPTAADQSILQDKSPHYRVLNLSSGDGPFNDAVTSYFHRSIGGYHAAKLSIYQDLIATQLQNKFNPSVLNMLDTRYIIVPSQQGQNGGAAVQKNPDALGAAWFVKHISYMPDEIAVLNALGNFNAKDTAFVAAKSGANQPVYDSTASIELRKYDNDTIQYITDAKSPQFAVLSEIYYPAGWNAYIDKKKTDYVQTNYVLRGIQVPAGKHEIEFRFEPASVSLAQTITLIANALFWLLILSSLFLLWKQQSIPKVKP
ncbi:MAG: YfhO family protein [Arachidicoccus sp.]|nr:YfhO family protein [Arachidicoccus sp.]